MLVLSYHFWLILALIPYFEVMSIDLDRVYTYIDLAGCIILAVLFSCLIERLDSSTTCDIMLYMLCAVLLMC